MRPTHRTRSLRRSHRTGGDGGWDGRPSQHDRMIRMRRTHRMRDGGGWGSRCARCSNIGVVLDGEVEVAHVVQGQVDDLFIQDQVDDLVIRRQVDELVIQGQVDDLVIQS